MTYATREQLVERVGLTELAQISRSTDGRTLDEQLLDRALADAGAQIDTALARRYAVPLAVGVVVPDLLVRIACEIARYLLWRDGAREGVVKRYEGAVAMLADLAAGRTLLPGLAPAASGAASVVDAQAVVVSPARARRF
jgi:phage gp36-like protein